MKHSKYRSIPKTHETKTTDYYVEQGFDKEEWYVSEKLHGANFSFLAAPGKSPVLHAERGDILENYQGGTVTKNFFNHMNLKVTAEFDDKIKRMAEYFGISLQVYTEFIGPGITNKPYIPYMNVPTDTVDKSIYRTFVVIDIMIIATQEFLSLDEMVEACVKFDLPYAPILFRGNMWDCIKYNTEFKSVYAANNGVDTDAEGIVIKPVRSLRTPNGERVILKHVAEKFSDTKLPAADRELKKQKEKAASEYNANNSIIQDRALEVRVTNRAAGLGIETTDKSKFGDLMKAVVEDIIQEVKKELDIDLETSQVTKFVVPLVKKFFA